MAFCKSKYAGAPQEALVSGTLQQWTKTMFECADGIVFIGSCGIAVRSIAPFVTKKDRDPAVVVTDEAGQFCISLLSGHLGGANVLTKKISHLTGSTPVITTATDIHGQFAVDNFADKNDLTIMDFGLAKDISARILAGEMITLECDGSWCGLLPESLSMNGRDIPCDIHIGTGRVKNDDSHILYLVPKVVMIGIGCKRGTDAGLIRKAIESALDIAGIFKEAVAGAASIDLKADEAGILEVCHENSWSFRTFSAEKLLKVPGTFSASDFVVQTTGVDCVCERSAMTAVQGSGSLILGKTVFEGVTVALAAQSWSVEF